MARYYPVFLLPTPLPNRQRLEEPMGTKTKYWLQNRATGRRVMVKYARPNTGEDWSEKLGCELGSRLGVPCPRVDLFEASDGRGVLCWDFLRTRRSAPGSAEPSAASGK